MKDYKFQLKPYAICDLLRLPLLLRGVVATQSVVELRQDREELRVLVAQIQRVQTVRYRRRARRSLIAET